MGGSKHWILCLAGIALLSTVALSHESGGHEDCQLEKRPENKRDLKTNDHWRILCELSRKFGPQYINKGCQYGVLYLPPPVPDNPLLPKYEPEQPETITPQPTLSLKGISIFPPETPGSSFQHNYVVTVPKKINEEIKHSEDRLLTDMYPQMLDWYSHFWTEQIPNVVYLYTYNSPCATSCVTEKRLQSCTTIIQEFIDEHRNQFQLYVGYTQIWSDALNKVNTVHDNARETR